jgi:hypothetical protein
MNAPGRGFVSGADPGLFGSQCNEKAVNNLVNGSIKQ